MQIVIDIPEDVYTRLFDNGIQDNEIAVDDVCEMARALRLGKPLEDIRSKILYEIYMDGVNMANEYHGCWVRFKNIETIVNRYMRERSEG